MGRFDDAMLAKSAAPFHFMLSGTSMRVRAFAGVIGCAEVTVRVVGAVDDDVGDDGAHGEIETVRVNASIFTRMSKPVRSTEVTFASFGVS